MTTQKIFENGRQTGEIVTNHGPNGSETTYAQTVHHGSLGTTYKTTDVVIHNDGKGHISIDDRRK